MEHVLDDDLAWLPADGVALSRAELGRIFSIVRALIMGTDEMDPGQA